MLAQLDFGEDPLRRLVRVETMRPAAVVFQHQFSGKPGADVRDRCHSPPTDGPRPVSGNGVHNRYRKLRNFRIAEDYRPILIVETFSPYAPHHSFSFETALPSFPGVSFMSILVGPWLWP